MKLHLAAIAYNERELDIYVAQLLGQGFEALSEVKKAEDGTVYRAMAKAVKQEIAPVLKEKVIEEASMAAS